LAARVAVIRRWLSIFSTDALPAVMDAGGFKRSAQKHHAPVSQYRDTQMRFSAGFQLMMDQA